MVRLVDWDGRRKTPHAARGVCNGRQGEVETDEGNSDESRGPNEGRSRDQGIRR